MATTNCDIHNRMLGYRLRNSGHSPTMGQYLCGISGWPWQKVPHIYIFLLYHLLQVVLLSLRIILGGFLECYVWNVDDCLIGHHARWRFQMSGARSNPWHSRPMATTSSQALPMEQFVCGMPRRERRWQALSLDTRIRSGLWDSRPMATTSSQARKMKQFVCGMPRPERWWQALSLDTCIGSGLWHSRPMATTSSQALSIEQFVCGMPRRERRWQALSLDTRIWSRLWHSRPMDATSSQA